jgi:hypothetical protein
VVVGIGLLLAACSDPKSARGFRLPEGEIEAGRAAFARLACTRCHSVAGESFAVPTEPDAIHVPLGGQVIRVATYGELVTAIIHPQHGIARTYRAQPGSRDAASPMPDLTGTMTVREMIDLVTFLQSHYELEMPDPTTYPII